MIKPIRSRTYKAYRRRINLSEDMPELEVAIDISERVTHRPGFIYQSDWDQKPNAEVNLPGGQQESIRSHHLAIERGERPFGDCDDFTETTCEMCYRAGVDARRLLKIIVCDEQTLAAGRPETVTHIVAGYFQGALPENGNVAHMAALDPFVVFESVITLGDTWDQAVRPRDYRPMVRENGRWVRHKPLAVSSPSTGISMFAVKGAESTLRRDRFLSAAGVMLGRPANFPACDPASLRM